MANKGARAYKTGMNCVRFSCEIIQHNTIPRYYEYNDRWSRVNEVNYGVSAKTVIAAFD